MGIRVEDQTRSTAGVTKLFPASRWDWSFICVGVFAVAAAIFRASKAGGFPLWDDEYPHVFAAKSLLNVGRPLLPSGQPYTRALPFTWLVSVSFRLFGVSELSARLPSIILGSLLVLFVFLLGRRYLGTATGVLAAALVAIDPINAPLMIISRMYSLLALLFLVTAFGLFESIRHVRKGSLSVWYTMLAIVAGLMALWTQLLVVFLVPGIIAYLLVMGRRDMRFGKTRRGRVEITSAMFLLLASALVYILQGGIINEAPAVHDISYWYFSDILLRNAWPAVIFFVLGLWAAISRENDFALFIACVAVGDFAVQSLLFPSWASARYLAQAMPPFYLLAAYGAAGLVRRKWVRPAAVMALVLVTLILALGSHIGDAYFAAPRYALASGFAGTTGAYGKAGVIVSTDPLASVYYLGRAGYWLRETRYSFYVISSSKGPLHFYSGALLISDHTTLRRLMLSTKSGWIFLDGRAGNLSSSTIDVIRKQCVLVARDRNRLKIYRWEQPSVSR